MKITTSLRALTVTGLLWTGIAGAAPSDYCIALRGNGELKPAHWGALAQTVETFGVPKAMSGGSSASISTFLLESILLNPYVNNEQLNNDSKLKAREVAFLIKSFEGFIYAQTDRPEYQRLFELLRTLQGANESESLFNRFSHWVQSKSTDELTDSYKDFETIFEQIKSSEIFYGPQVKSFINALNDYRNEGVTAVFDSEKLDTLKREHAKLKSSLAVFGKFDAKNDKTLFVRDGIVNFPALARAFDVMANFYSLRGATDDTKNRFKTFLETCSPNSEGKGWRSIMTQSPSCQQHLSETINSFVNTRDKSQSRLQDPIGSYLPALISTSVVIGDSRAEFKKLRERYLADKTIGQEGDAADNSAPTETGSQQAYDFQLPEKDLRFGYWGKTADLEAVQKFFTEQSQNPISQIDKSKKFMALGETTWAYALSFSPAEPGLSSLLPFKVGEEEYISMGGWSDLQPVPILKAKGCDKVVYVTRRGGESIFAQGVAKRLLGFPQLPWEELDPSNADTNMTQALNNRGRATDADPKWSSMFNLANPKSSFSVSLQLADVVVCTNWNSFDVTKNFKELIDDAYAAPIYMPQDMELLDLKKPTFIKKEHNDTVTRLSQSGQPLAGQTYPRYGGCIPN